MITGPYAKLMNVQDLLLSAHEGEGFGKAKEAPLLFIIGSHDQIKLQEDWASKGYSFTFTDNGPPIFIEGSLLFGNSYFLQDFNSIIGADPTSMIAIEPTVAAIEHVATYWTNGYYGWYSTAGGDNSSNVQGMLSALNEDYGCLPRNISRISICINTAWRLVRMYSFLNMIFLFVATLLDLIFISTHDTYNIIKHDRASSSMMITSPNAKLMNIHDLLLLAHEGEGFGKTKEAPPLFIIGSHDQIKLLEDLSSLHVHSLCLWFTFPSVVAIDLLFTVILAVGLFIVGSRCIQHFRDVVGSRCIEVKIRDVSNFEFCQWSCAGRIFKLTLLAFANLAFVQAVSDLLIYLEVLFKSKLTCIALLLYNYS